METKKKLRKDIEALQMELKSLQAIFQKELGAIKLQIAEMQKAEEDEMDIISGSEAAKMLGWQSGYVSSTWLDKVNIKYTKGDNGCLKISKKDIEDYLATRETTTED